MAAGGFESGSVGAVNLQGVAASKIRASSIDHPAQSGRAVSCSWRLAKMAAGGFENGAVDAVYLPKITGVRKPSSRYRPPHPMRAVDGLLLVSGENGGGWF